MAQVKQGDVASLLDKTQAAHGVYEVGELQGVYDEDWPSWYAAYLIEHGLGDLLGRPIAAEQLARLLKLYDENYRTRQLQEGWPDYYAAQLLAWRDVAEG